MNEADKLRIEQIRKYTLGTCNACGHVTQAPERIGQRCTQMRLDGRPCPGVYIKTER